MMNQRRNVASLAAMAFVGGLSLAAQPSLQAQGLSGAPSKPRTTDERTVTEQNTPPPVNSDYRKAAQGQLPKAATPAPGGAVDPATTLPPGGSRTPAMDPAARLQPAVVAPGTRLGSNVPAGMDVAMLIEHAVGMAIEGSALLSIAEQAGPDKNESAKMLLNHARQEMAESKALMTAASSDGQSIDGASPTRRFFSAANNYLATLNKMGTSASPADRAQVAMMNHAVKAVLDSGHIRQFGQAYSGSPATEQLMTHAAMMNDMGMRTITQAAATGSPDATLLARQARDLVDAAQAVASRPGMPVPGTGANPTTTLSPGPNPGRLQDTRPEIIGGTQATGSPTAGTTTPESSAKAINNGGGTKANDTTTTGPSNGGLRPR